MRYLLIPSHEVAPFNALTGTTTSRRLEAGLKLWQEGCFHKIIVCGGIFHPPGIQNAPAARLMKVWLTERGVKGHHILCEVESRDTYENVAFSLKLMGGDKCAQIAVATHWQHAWRFWLTFYLGYGIRVRIIKLWYWAGFISFFTEWIFLFLHLIDPKGEGKIANFTRKRRTYES